MLPLIFGCVDGLLAASHGLYQQVGLRLRAPRGVHRHRKGKLSFRFRCCGAGDQLQSRHGHKRWRVRQVSLTKYEGR